MVLIHGGGGHAFHEWVAEWTKRGYVAIAMDNTGFFPKKAGASMDNNDWVHGVNKNADFKESGYASVMQTDHFATSGNPVERRWMYHAVVQAILARNLLANDATVDASKIGITGISWGSVITALTIGYENRFAFAVPQYCAGYLNESLTYKGEYCKDYPAYNYLWQAEDRFDNITFPVLWLQWTQDYSTTPNSNSLCYLHTKNQGGELSFIMDWWHSHDWSKEVVYYYANCVLNGKQALTKVIDEPQGRDFSFAVSKPEGATVTAKIYYMTHDLLPRPTDHNPNEWYVAEATINGNTVTGKVPADATHYYVEFSNTVGGQTYYSASSIVYVD